MRALTCLTDRAQATLLGVAVMFSPSLAWSENQPFYNETSLASGLTFAVGTAIGDLDGDGDLDVVASGNLAGEIIWIENLSGDFSSKTEHTIQDSVGFPTQIALGDIDRDGDLDVAVAQPGDDAVGVYFNNGDASGWTVSTLNDIDNATGVALGDLNGDGTLDLVATGGGDLNGLRLLYRQGNFWFSTSDGDLPLDGAQSVRIADIDRDGHADIVATGFAADEVVVFTNPGPSRGSWTSESVVTNLDEAWGLAVGDLDGDGDLDIAATSIADDDVAWFENGASWARHDVDTSFDGPRHVEIADVDRDGDMDVVAAGDLADMVTWWENRAGDGTNWSQRDPVFSLDGAITPRVADIDGDGDIDLVGSGVNDGGRVVAFLNLRLHPQFSFPAAEEVGDTSLGAWAASVDIDRDGANDVVGIALENGSYELQWWTGPGSSSPFSKTLIPTTSSPSVGAVGDLDRDGDHDLVVLGSGAFRWLENLGAGAMWTEHTLTTEMYGNTIKIADINGDGLPDLVTIDTLQDIVSWWENLGPGLGFLESEFAPGFAEGFDLAISDIDGDGDLDIVGASGDGTIGLVWWEQTSTGLTRRDVEVRATEVVVVEDLDRDGDQDLIAGDLGTGALYWYENDGSSTPSWTEHSVLSSHRTRALTVGDFDQDGDSDIAAASAVDNEIVLLENAGDQATWTQHVTSLNSVTSLSASDLNHDGFLDLLVARSAGLDWIPNVGGQAAISVDDPATRNSTRGGDGFALAERGTEVLVAVVDYEHLGKAVDDPMRLGQLQIQFRDPDGQPLDMADVGLDLEFVNFVLDGGDGVFDGAGTGDDTFLTDRRLVLVSGTETEVDLGTETTLEPAETARVFVSLEVDPTADARAFSFAILENETFARDPRQSIRLLTHEPQTFESDLFEIPPPPSSSSEPPPAPGHVTISAIVANDGSGDEFFELQNQTSRAVSLENCRLVVADAFCSVSDVFELDDAGQCSAASDQCLTCAGGDCDLGGQGSYFLLGSSAGGAVDTSFGAIGLNNNGSVTLQCGEDIIDRVGFGLAGGCYESAAYSSGPGFGQAIARFDRETCSVDTDRNAQDFETMSPVPALFGRSDPPGTCTDVIFEDGFEAGNVTSWQ